MEIPAWLLFSFWAVISITFLHLGFEALDKTELSNSVSPVIMFFFKHFLAISSCCSSHYALIFLPKSRYDAYMYCFSLACAVFPIIIYSIIGKTYTILSGALSYAVIELAWLTRFLPNMKIFANWYLLIMIIIFLPSVWFSRYFQILALICIILIFGLHHLTPAQKTCIGIQTAIGTSLFSVGRENQRFSPMLVLFVSICISILSPSSRRTRDYRDPLSVDEIFKPIMVKLKEIFSALKEKKIGKLIEFAVGMGGTVLFQNFFRLTSFNEVVAFLYLAMMWVANLGLLGVSSDFGVLNFLLGNVVVGCTVSQFGLRSTTWLAYGAALLLYGLRLKLESLTLAHGQGEHIQVTLWFESSPSLLPV